MTDEKKKDERKFYQKKRVIIPVIFVLISGIGSIFVQKDIQQLVEKCSNGSSEACKELEDTYEYRVVDGKKVEIEKEDPVRDMIAKLNACKTVLKMSLKDPDSYKFLNTKGNLTHTNVDDYAEAEIEINKKIRCQIKVSFKENYQNKTIIEGQKGKLIINSPWLPEKQTNLEISQGSSYYKKIVNSDLSLYANQIEKVSDNFEKNRKDDKFLVNIQDSLAIMKNMSIWSKLIKK